ncbi:MAG: ABC transporter permease, partial [Clostridia bacterium]|nr:ABC transporter permease [Clostridia bacterium]
MNEQNLINLDEFNLSNDELFAHVDNNSLDSEKITAPRYSYWQSVFRVFFRKKINIIILSLLAVIIVFTYVYPMIIGYNPDVDPFINIMDGSSKHLTPGKAIAKHG